MAPRMPMGQAQGLGVCLALGAAFAAGPGHAQERPSPTVQTRDFLAAAAASDLFETVEAQVVGAQSRDPRVRAFAQEMTRDHAGTRATLRSAATRSGMAPPPDALSGDQARLLGALQSVDGQVLDKVYARQQVLAHTEALVIERAYAATGADAGLRQAAETSIPIIQHHLDMARRLAAAVGAS